MRKKGRILSVPSNREVKNNFLKHAAANLASFWIFLYQVFRLFCVLIVGIFVLRQMLSNHDQFVGRIVKTLHYGEKMPSLERLSLPVTGRCIILSTESFCWLMATFECGGWDSQFLAGFEPGISCSLGRQVEPLSTKSLTQLLNSL